MGNNSMPREKVKAARRSPHPVSRMWKDACGPGRVPATRHPSL